MKKLLCMLMLGMVFSQDVIITKEYSVEINSTIENIDILDLIGESQGTYLLEVAEYQVISYPEDGCDINIDSNLGDTESIAYYSNETFIRIDFDRVMLDVNAGLAVNAQNPNININNCDEGEMDCPDPCSNHSGNLILHISGKFNDDSGDADGDGYDDVCYEAGAGSVDTDAYFDDGYVAGVSSGDHNLDGNLDIMDIVYFVQLILNP